MPLPSYGRSKKNMPVLDHRATANPWATTPTADDAFGGPVDDVIGITSELSPAERAKTVVCNSRLATLSIVLDSTTARATGMGGEPTPAGFTVPFALDNDAFPLVVLRPHLHRAAGTRNGQPASLTLAETPLTAAPGGVACSTTIVGCLQFIDGKESVAAALNVLSRTLPAEANAVQRSAAAVARLEPSALIVGQADGSYVRVSVSEYQSADADPLSAIAPGLVTHLSADQSGTLVLLARAFGGIPEATAAQLVAIDQYGMDVLVTSSHGRETIRLAFTQPVGGPEEVRKEVASMVRGARFKLGVG